jgi:hypothetical protein
MWLEGNFTLDENTRIFKVLYKPQERASFFPSIFAFSWEKKKRLNDWQRNTTNLHKIKALRS